MSGQSVFDQVPNCVGGMICGTDGHVLQSHGQLTNREDLGQLLLDLLYRAEQLLQQCSGAGGFQSITVYTDDGAHYVITCQQDRVYIAKRSGA